VPILLSFYALSNGTRNLFMGQLSFSSLRDFSFRSYGSRKTFRTLLALYRTRFFAHKEIVLQFDHGAAATQTDASGSFFFTSDAIPLQMELQAIQVDNNQSVQILEGLYDRTIRTIEAKNIMISDIDDTLLHSHISNKLLKFRTLMFTSMEKRKAVHSTRKLVNDLNVLGVIPFYLSNSEQNLYPLILRFLQHHGFPSGPLFLKQMRKVKDVFRRVKSSERDSHKNKMLDQILNFFPDKRYFLVGDNTQNDLRIYLKAAAHHPEKVRHIIIRKVLRNAHEESFLKETIHKLQASNIGFYYGEDFPATFDLR
jgi:phosphatidate phosphatase APP1